MVLDLSGKNLSDDTVIDVLQEQFGTDKDRAIELDMTFNRLTLTGLEAIIDFMRPRRNVRVCVGENSFHFAPFFKTMQERGVDSWIDSERLTMGRTPVSKDTDRLLARCMRDSDGIEALRQFNLEMHRRQDVRWARADERQREADERWNRKQNKIQEEAAQRKIELDSLSLKNDKARSEVTDQIKQLFGYQRNRNKQIEEEVEEAVRLYCKNLGCTDEDDVQVYDKNLHLVKGKNKQKLFEWDGLVTAKIDNDNILFLIEAKHYVTEDHVANMAERLAITRQFIQEAAKEDLSTCTPRYAYQAGAFAGFKGHVIRGVVGGASVTEAMSEEILRLGYYLVRLENLEYTVTPPASTADS